MFFQASLGELNLVDTISVDNVLEVNRVIFGVAIDCDVALLNPGPESLNDVASFIDENGGVIPAGEYLIRTPVPDLLTEADQAACPTGAVSKDEIATARIYDLFSRWKTAN